MESLFTAEILIALATLTSVETITVTSGGKTMEVTVEPDGRLKSSIMGLDIYFKK